MLIAIFEKQRILATLAQKGYTYFCPACQQEVVLKKGKRVIHHFSHKPPVTCSWSLGETKVHLKAKSLFYDYFFQQGFFADVEFTMGSCRADVYVRKQKRMPMVFEMQHTSITETEITDRTQAYFLQNVAMTWLPLMDFEKLKNRKPYPNGSLVERYSPKQYEKWLHGFMASWFASGGSENSSGGYEKRLKKLKNLILIGPFALKQIDFKLMRRAGDNFAGYDYPTGCRIDLTVR